MSKPYILEATESAITIFVEVTHAIKVGGITHDPGSIIDVSPDDAGTLIAAGVALRVSPTRSNRVPIEEQLPSGLDPRVWRADPRLVVNGQRPSSFVRIVDFEESHPRR